MRVDRELMRKGARGHREDLYGQISAFPVQCGWKSLDSRAYNLLHYELSTHLFSRQHKVETSTNGLTSLQVVKGIHFKVLTFQRPKFCLQQMSLHNAKHCGLKNKAVIFYFM